MRSAMFDAVRSLLHRAIVTPRGDSIRAVRVPKEIVRGLNDYLGGPLCSADEIQRRRAAEKRLEELRRGPRKVTKKREAAPVMVYFEKDQHHRQLLKVTEILAARKIAYTRLDITGDAATLEFVLRESRRQKDDLPLVFIGGTAVGGARELGELDGKGGLVKAVFGAD